MLYVPFIYIILLFLFLNKNNLTLLYAINLKKAR